MKRGFVFLGLTVLVLGAAQASILTNTNQSAQYIRMLSRNASTDIDAVYYNPAGLTKLADGWHFALHNQTIFQKKTVISEFPLLNESTFEGKVSAPIFPSAFIAYKMDKLVLSFGFGPNSGGGSADFSKGLPSIETQLSIIPVLMTMAGIPADGYQANVAFKGTSMFLGFQLNASYEVADFLSVGLGARLLSCKNTYEGSITGFMINTLWFGWIPYGSDFAVKAKETGMGFTPILSLNFSPMDKLNVSLRYEFKTKVELTTKTDQDDLGMFPDGQKVRSDLPAMLSFGLGYSVMPKMRVMLSFNSWCDKDMDWDGDYEDGTALNLEANSWDLGAGLEYDLTDRLLVSVGFLHTQMTPGDDYQTDLRHELSSNTIGAGLRYKISDMFDVNIGGLFGFYGDDQEDLSYGILGTWPMTYQRTNWAVSVGLGGRF